MNLRLMERFCWLGCFFTLSLVSCEGPEMTSRLDTLADNASDVDILDAGVDLGEPDAEIADIMPIDGGPVDVGEDRFCFTSSTTSGLYPTHPTMVSISGGTFLMGASATDTDVTPEEKPEHPVIVRDFMMAESEVTQEQWCQTMGLRYLSAFQGELRPVERVTFSAALLYLNRLSELESLESCYALQDCDGSGSDGNFRCNLITYKGPNCSGYRLPTEAEWEYAALGGVDAPLYGDLNLIAWYNQNNDGDTQIVKTKAPNQYGLYDMIGNVWEYTNDPSRIYAASNTPIADPGAKSFTTGPRITMLRGCGWSWSSSDCRSTARGFAWPGTASPDIGFRPVRTSTISAP